MLNTVKSLLLHLFGMVLGGLVFWFVVVWLLVPEKELERKWRDARDWVVGERHAEGLAVVAQDEKRTYLLAQTNETQTAVQKAEVVQDETLAR